MGELRPKHHWFQFSARNVLLWTAVVAVAAGVLVLALDPFSLVESFTVVTRSPTGNPVAMRLSRIYFAVMLIACAVGILWFCFSLIRRRRKNDRSNSLGAPRHD